VNRIILRTNITAEKQMLLRCKNFLKRLPKGSLTCYKSKNTLYFKKYDKHGLKYAGTENAPIVSKLKVRHLLETMIPIMENNIRLMEELFAGYREFDPLYLQKSFKRSYQNIPLEMLTELGYYTDSADDSYYHDSKIYKTSSGLEVRSRIEALIAEIYLKKGISFTYEAVIHLPDGSQMHPDFTVYCPASGKYKYHEHIGLLSDPKYLDTYMWKLEHYISNDLYPFYDVLFTYEKPDMGIDMAEIEYLIDAFMK